MTTIALLRTTYLNLYLQRTDGDPLPWTDAACNQALTDAMGDLWPDLGLRATGTVATSSATGLVTIPGAIVRVTRIDIEDSSGNPVDQITNWRYYPDADPPTKVRYQPLIQSGYSLRFFGWKPFADTGSDLLPRLENTVAYLAASKAYGMLLGLLVNSQRQQGLDSGRVVDYQTAAGLSAYWLRMYKDGTKDDPNSLSYAPRASRR